MRNYLRTSFLLLLILAGFFVGGVVVFVFYSRGENPDFIIGALIGALTGMVVALFLDFLSSRNPEGALQRARLFLTQRGSKSPRR
jgi:hypothetical protein